MSCFCLYSVHLVLIRFGLVRFKEETTNKSAWAHVSNNKRRDYE